LETPFKGSTLGPAWPTKNQMSRRASVAAAWLVDRDVGLLELFVDDQGFA